MHSLVFVIIPAATRDIAAEVERLLAGSEADPKKVFPQYEIPCSCVGFRARMESFKQFDASPPGVELQSRLQSARENKSKVLEGEILLDRVDAVEAIERAHPNYQKVDLGCRACHGTSVCVRSCDPCSHMDYWVIGGRWSGLFRNLEPAIATRNKKLRFNVTRVRNIPEELRPAAIVTPEGYWCEGPIALSGSAKLEERLRDEEKHRRALWGQQVQEMMQTYAWELAVIVDTHF